MTNLAAAASSSPEARAARASGCTLVSVRESPRGAVFDCEDGWGAARLLVELSDDDLDPSDPRARPLLALGRDLRNMGATDAERVDLIQRFVVQHVAFVEEVGEKFQHPVHTLESAEGDCDCHARLVRALLRAAGIRARLGFFSGHEPGSQPAHVAAQAKVSGRWLWVETTVPGARAGDDPIEAAERAGVLRSDVAPEFGRVTTMGELGSGVEGGVRYRARLSVSAAPEWLGGLTPEDFVREAIARAGFCDIDVWIDEAELPRDWRESERHAVTSRPWPAWVEATYARDDSRELPRELGALVFESLWTASDDAAASAAQEASSGAAPVEAPHDIGGLSGTFTHEEAREIMQRAWRDVFGRDGTRDEVDTGLAVAHLETAYGRAPGNFFTMAARGDFNWGALERGFAPCPKTRELFGEQVKMVEGTDAGRRTCFFAFPSDLEAAKAFVRVWAKQDGMIDAIAQGPRAVATVMRRHGYYEGFWVGPGTPNDKAHPQPPFKVAPSAEEALDRNIAEYTQAITNHLRIVRGPGGVASPATARGRTVGGVLLGIGLLVATGAAIREVVTRWL